MILPAFLYFVLISINNNATLSTTNIAMLVTTHILEKKAKTGWACSNVFSEIKSNINPSFLDYCLRTIKSSGVTDLGTTPSLSESVGAFTMFLLISVL